MTNFFDLSRITRAIKVIPIKNRNAYGVTSLFYTFIRIIAKITLSER